MVTEANDLDQPLYIPFMDSANLSKSIQYGRSRACIKCPFSAPSICPFQSYSSLKGAPKVHFSVTFQ
jgi:hypothetical protein